MLRVAAFVISLVVAPASLWAYSVQVNKVPDFATSFSKLAVLPAACPPDFDCLWVEAVLGDKLRARGLDVMPTVVVRQWMFDLEITAVTPENRNVLRRETRCRGVRYRGSGFRWNRGGRDDGSVRRQHLYSCSL